MALRDVDRRLKAVAQTAEVTEAMRVVASSRLDGAISQYEQFLPFLEGVRSIASRFAGQAAGGKWPAGMSGPRWVVVIGSERGLAGAYHAGLAGAVERLVHEDGETSILVVGRRMGDYLHRRGFREERFWPGPTEQVRRTVHDMRDRIVESNRPLTLVYTRFDSMAHQEVVTAGVLPVTGTREGPDELLVEPQVEQVAPVLLKVLVSAELGGALRSALASEHAARMMAMTTASENAHDMMDELVLEKHRIRQGQITTELAELIGGMGES